MKPKQTIHSLQALRAIAAWLVIVDHALLELSHNDIGNPTTHLAWTLGSSGVAVFFVISGFIMVHICWHGFGHAYASADFLKRRILRIVPLYWLATLVALAYHKVSATHGARDGWPELARSLAFIPYAGPEGAWSPILPQGWTLNYEMMFYVIFGLGLSFRRQLALPAIAMCLGFFVATGPLLASPAVTFLASPIVLWFVLGMGLAIAWRWLKLAEPAWLAAKSLLLEPFGNASYSTYLCHGFVLTMLLRLWTVVFGSVSLWIVPVSVIAATVAGLATHILVERPILQAMTNPGAGRKAAQA